MLSILKAHLNKLNELKLLLEKEKSALINLDEEALMGIVHLKSEKVKEIDEIESNRMETFGEDSFQSFVKENKEAVNLIDRIKQVVHEIQELQEMNLLLTQQAMDYNSTLMTLVQKALKKSTQTYGYNGKIKSANLGAKGSLDKSV